MSLMPRSCRRRRPSRLRRPVSWCKAYARCARIGRLVAAEPRADRAATFACVDGRGPSALRSVLRVDSERWVALKRSVRCATRTRSVVQRTHRADCGESCRYRCMTVLDASRYLVRAVRPPGASPCSVRFGVRDLW